MNFLKKKLKTVVHGKRNKDDDDDFDNYIPEVPPHPSVNASTLASSSIPHFASTSLFDSFNNTITGAATSALDFASNSLFSVQSENQKSSEDSNLTLEELKEREEEHKRIEKEKLKQQHEEKKDNADWQFFLSLTAKVDAVTSNTQSVLDKLKDFSAVKEIAALEEQEVFGEELYGEEAPKSVGNWIAFDENVQFNPSDPIFSQPKQEENKPVEKVNFEKDKQLEKQLLHDFGFGTEIETIVETENLQNNIDPFDTSSFDIEAIKAGKVPPIKVKSDNLLQDFEIKQIDPFDTSHIESAISTDLTL